MPIELKRGKSKNGVIEFYFVGMDFYDEFDWFLDFLLRRSDTRLIEKIDGIYFRIARIETQGVYYEVSQHDDIGYYAHIQGDETDKALSLVGQIFVELSESINTIQR